MVDNTKIAKANMAELNKGKAGLLDADIFDFEKKAGSGGVTGSIRVPLLSADKQNGHNYQYKSSIVNAALSRRLKAGGVDRENFGEVISSKIAMAVLNSTTNSNNAPDVHLVYDSKRKQINIASRYLDNVKGTLDSYLADATDFKRADKKHISIVHDYDPAVHHSAAISFDHKAVKELSRSLALAITVSALIGDHDVNPGNMMVIGDERGGVKAVRIDFGHALNDLLNAPSNFGGGLKDSQHPVLDFFNRSYVSGFPKPAVSKLWRDYSGIVPSEELATALATVANDAREKIKVGIADAKNEFKQLLIMLITKNNFNGVVHLFDSLNAMNLNFTGNSITPPSKSELKNLDKMGLATIVGKMNKIFDQLSNKFELHADDMLRTSNILKLQTAVDDLIRAELVTPRDDKSIDKINENIKNLKTIIGSDNKDWVKTDAIQEAFHGDFDAYLKQRKNFLLPMIQNKIYQEAVINKTHSLVDQVVQLEKQAIENGLTMNTFQILSIKPGDQSNITEVNQIAALKQQITQFEPLINQLAIKNKGVLQWPASVIGKELPPFKGTLEEYIDRRRTDIGVIAARMIYRSEEYKSNINKQAFASLREGMHKSAMIENAVNNASRYLQQGDVNSAKRCISDLEKRYIDKYGENITKSKGYEVIKELKADIELAVKKNNNEDRPASP